MIHATAAEVATHEPHENATRRRQAASHATYVFMQVQVSNADLMRALRCRDMKCLTLLQGAKS